MMKLIYLALASLLFLAPAYGGETPWIEIAPQARIRLVSTDTEVDGKVLAAIEIDMPQTTKTYWRIPGETGIPLLMDAGKSSAIKNAEILWPYPTRETAGGFIDFVYHGHTVLPVALEVAGDTPNFAANLLLGVCDEICVPVHVDLTLEIKLNKPDTAQQLRIAQAMAEVPLEWTTQPEPFGIITFDATTRRLSVPYLPGTIDPASLIADTGNPSQLFSLPQKSPENDVLLFEMLGEGGDLGQGSSQITLTFMTDSGAFELSRTLAPTPIAQ